MTAVVADPDAPAASAFFDPTAFGLGVVIPVVGGHPGCGATGVALALADAAAAAGLRTLLIDGADPARSGLANVWTHALKSDPPARDRVIVSTSRRGPLVGRHLLSSGSPLPAAAYPSLDRWAASNAIREHGPFDLTVVDVAWDAWRGFSEVRFGPLAWLGGVGHATAPVLVARGTAPSLRLTAGVHARWSSALATAAVEAPPLLTLTAIKTVSDRVRHTAPPSLHPALDDAVLVPFDAPAEHDGWSARALSAASLRSAGELLTRLPEAIASRVPPIEHPQRRFRRAPKEN